jgi:hypothetical protein
MARHLSENFGSAFRMKSYFYGKKYYKCGIHPVGASATDDVSGGQLNARMHCINRSVVEQMSARQPLQCTNVRCLNRNLLAIYLSLDEFIREIWKYSMIAGGSFFRDVIVRGRQTVSGMLVCRMGR